MTIQINTLLKCNLSSTREIVLRRIENLEVEANELLDEKQTEARKVLNELNDKQEEMKRELNKVNVQQQKMIEILTEMSKRMEKLAEKIKWSELVWNILNFWGESVPNEWMSVWGLQTLVSPIGDLNSQES